VFLVSSLLFHISLCNISLLAFFVCIYTFLFT
jgi:hypothetical protein